MQAVRGCSDILKASNASESKEPARQGTYLTPIVNVTAADAHGFDLDSDIA